MSLVSRSLNALARLGRLYADGFAMVGASMGYWGHPFQPYDEDRAKLQEGDTYAGSYQPRSATQPPPEKSHTPRV